MCGARRAIAEPWPDRRPGGRCVINSRVARSSHGTRPGACRFKRGPLLLAVAAPLLEICDLVTEFRTDRGVVRAVDGVSLAIKQGQTLGVVGESGCGKSVTALSVLRLIAHPAGRIAGGEIRYKERNLLTMSPDEMRTIRGNRIAMIFQEPMTSLNPVFTIGDQIGEAIRLHQKKSKAEARAATIAALKQVGIPAAEQRVDDYPHQLSGGMRQRVMIAMALCCKPDVLIADEPTTALDVTIQAQILDLLRKLQRDTQMSMMLITHDLGVVAQTCDDVAVMYAGRVVEHSPANQLFATPHHPYTAGLLRSMPEAAPHPVADTPRESGQVGRTRRPKLQEIAGMVPSLFDLPAGCAFAERCDIAQARCRTELPLLTDLTHVGWPGRSVRCHFPLNMALSVGAEL
ncbi:MAG: ABC transporter ATP-binding protein [Kofleriaceae bacterium]|nr:ABC transporter ATP-binding protein [Kofleriaceae bacterium]